MSDTPEPRMPAEDPPPEPSLDPIPLPGAGGPVGGPVAGEVLDVLNQPIAPPDELPPS